MYTARIIRNNTQEMIEVPGLTLREALRLVNIAWFSCGYQEEALSACIIDEASGRVLRAWWEDDITDKSFEEV